MHKETEPENREESEPGLNPQIYEYPMEELDGLVRILCDQMNNDLEEGTFREVFSGAFKEGLRGSAFVAKNEEKIAGLGVASLKNEQEGVVEALYVVKNYRLAKQGVGTRLTDAMVEYLIKNGIKKIHVTVTSEGMRKITEKLHKKLGDLIEIKDFGINFFQ